LEPLESGCSQLGAIFDYLWAPIWKLRGKLGEGFGNFLIELQGRSGVTTLLKGLRLLVGAIQVQVLLGAVASGLSEQLGG
jgi:hypothetical protein